MTATRTCSTTAPFTISLLAIFLPDAIGSAAQPPAFASIGSDAPSRADQARAKPPPLGLPEPGRDQAEGKDDQQHTKQHLEPTGAAEENEHSKERQDQDGKRAQQLPQARHGRARLSLVAA